MGEKMKRGSTQRNLHGFTLAEVLVTIAIVAILTAIALPSYSSFIIRANRSAAQQFMSIVASREEQVLIDLRSYVAVASANFANSPTAGSPGVNLPVSTEAGNFYTFQVTTSGGPPPSYMIIGTPIAGKKNASDHALYLSSTGARWRDINDNGTYESATDVDWSKR